MKQNPAVVAQIWSMRDARQRVQQFQEGLVRLRQSDRAFDIVQACHLAVAVCEAWGEFSQGLLQVKKGGTVSTSILIN